MITSNNSTIIPTKILPNLTINFLNKIERISVPISTYETTLFASINRGIKISQEHHINVNVLSSNMTRSIILECKTINQITNIINFLDKNKHDNYKEFQQIIDTTSSHCKLQNITYQAVGRLLYVRFTYTTDEASGHNMTTIATNELAKYLAKILDVKYVSNSGNTCCDKKVSAINSIEGRGKNVIAEMIISKKTCENVLHTSIKKIIDLNIKKNLLGSTLAGSICSSNAHYANMLASIYLPLGQDIANIVEGSQGITYCEMIDENEMYFSVNLPNIICGCIGNGKNLDFVKHNLQLIGCFDEKNTLIENASKRMAGIIGAVVLCGELSLLAALTNQDELVRSHKLFERNLINKH